MTESQVSHLTDENFDDAISKGVVLVDVWAPWCAPCLVQGPIVEKVAKTIGDKAKVAKLNADEGNLTAARFGIQSIPTLLLMKDGAEVDRFIGLQNESTLISAVNRVLES